MVYVKSSLIYRPVKVGIRLSLPFEAVHLILGNDLAGDKVVVNPVLTGKPCLEPYQDPVAKLFPSMCHDKSNE